MNITTDFFNKDVAQAVHFLLFGGGCTNKTQFSAQVPELGHTICPSEERPCSLVGAGGKIRLCVSADDGHDACQPSLLLLARRSLWLTSLSAICTTARNSLFVKLVCHTSFCLCRVVDGLSRSPPAILSCAVSSCSSSPSLPCV